MFVFFSRMKKQKISHCRSSSLSGLGTSTSIKQGGITQVVHGHKPKQFYWWVELWLCNSIFTATAKDLSNTNADNQDKCNCSNELESCLPTTFCSTEDMISRFENCLKTGCCPHVVPLEHNDASRTVSGFYWRCQTTNSPIRAWNIYESSPFSRKKFLSLCSIVKTTEWNGLIKIDNWS